MKTPIACLALIALAAPAAADEKLLPFSDSATYFSPAIGKMVNVRFSDSFASTHLPKPDLDKLIVSELPEGKVCFFVREDSLKMDDPKIKDVVRTDQGDMCVARSDASVRYAPQDVAGAPPMPFYSTDIDRCTWSWLKGKDFGVWAESCTFDTGTWSLAFDDATDAFTLNVEGSDPFPVLRQFRKKPEEDLSVLLPMLREKSLIPNDNECQFAPADTDEHPPGWTLYEIVPTGKKKELFDAQPDDEIPEPPCGDLGHAVDYVGFFLVPDAHKDRVYHVDLGQDGTMFDPFTITPFQAD